MEVKAQPRCCLPLRLSPLPEVSNESLMSMNTIELNKLNILREADLVLNPPLEIRAIHIATKPPYFMGNSLWFFNGI